MISKPLQPIDFSVYFCDADGNPFVNSEMIGMPGNQYEQAFAPYATIKKPNGESLSEGRMFPLGKDFSFDTSEFDINDLPHPGWYRFYVTGENVIDEGIYTIEVSFDPESSIASGIVNPSCQRLSWKVSSLYGIESSNPSIKWTFTCLGEGNVPQEGCKMWLSTDAAGKNIAHGAKYADAEGKITWLTNKGKYYAWRSYQDVEFNNPLQIIVTEGGYTNA